MPLSKIILQLFLPVCATLTLLAAGPAPATPRLLGVCTHFAIRPGDFPRAQPLLAGLGVGSFRDEAYWSHLEKVKGVRIFPPGLKASYLALAAQGIRPLVVLGYGNPHYDGGGKPRSPEALQGYADYCAFVARELAACDPVLEIWNEWDLGKDAGTLPEYLRLVGHGARAIRAVAPGATILVGSLTSAAIRNGWHLGLLDPSILPLVDGISIHPYVHHEKGAANSPEGLGRWVAEVAAALDGREGGAQLGLYVTEIGWSSYLGRWGLTQKLRADFAVRTFRVLSAIPKVRGIWWYDFMNDGGNPLESEHRYGLVDEAFRPLPAYDRLKALLKPAPRGRGLKGLPHP